MQHHDLQVLSSPWQNLDLLNPEFFILIDLMKIIIRRYLLLEKAISSLVRRLITVLLDLAKVVKPHLATVAFQQVKGFFFVSAYQFSE